MTLAVIALNISIWSVQAVHCGGRGFRAIDLSKIWGHVLHSLAVVHTDDEQDKRCTVGKERRQEAVKKARDSFWPTSRIISKTQYQDEAGQTEF